MLGVRAFLFPSDNRGVAGLVFFGWRGAIAAILAGLAASFLLAGYWYPYWRMADMDLMMAYQGFLVNSGHPQDFFDHPGHLSIILTSVWFELFHKLGFIDALTLSQIPPAADAAAFDRVWTQAVRAGRLLSLVEAISFIITFMWLLRRLVRDGQVTVLATFCLAFSGGLMMNARTLRTDMVAAGLVTIGFLILLIAARTPQSSWRPLWVGSAAFLCTLGLVNKVQALFLISALLPAVVFFGVTAAPQSFWRTRNAMFALASMAILAVALALPALDLIRIGFAANASVPPPFGVRGMYQGLFVALVVLSMLTFARVWRVPAAEVLAAMLAVAAGVSLGLLSLDVLYHPRNVAIIVNPLEHMFGWAGNSDPKLRAANSILSGELLRALGAGVLEVMARRTFVLHSSGRPTLVLEWLVIAGAVLAWRRGDRRVVWQVLALMAVVWAVDVVGTLRGLKLEYFIYADPLVIIAAAWLLTHMPDLKTHRWAFAVGVAVFVVHLALGQAGPIKHIFRKAGPEGDCGWLPHYASRIERFSFCPPRT